MPPLSDPPLQDTTKESKNGTGRKTDLSFSTLCVADTGLLGRETAFSHES